MEKIFKLELSESQVQFVGQVLAQQPYAHVVDLMKDIQSQVTEQRCCGDKEDCKTPPCPEDS